jgi:uncharacterized radical SAM superfamily protein
MTEVSAEDIWSLSEKDFLALLNSGRLASAKRRVTFYAPSFAYHKAASASCSQAKFPTISVTGNACALGCKHCGGKVLETMHPAETPQKLFALATRLKREGAVGCLVSGGCLPNGSVPLDEFAPILGRMKRELGLTVTVHTGIINLSTAKALKDVGIDAALIDVIGSDDPLKQVLNLNVTTGYYEDSLRALSGAGLRFVPHIIVGLQDGKLDGEFEALRMISRYEPSALVGIAFMPIRGTEMEHVKPPSAIDIARVVATARLMFPATPLALGCMRPKGRHRAETDVLALRTGVEGMAFPSEEAIKYSEAHGYEVGFSPYCCSQIYVDMTVRTVSK